MPTFSTFFARFLGLSLFILLFLVQNKHLQAQTTSKLNIELFRLLAETPITQQDRLYLPVLIKGNLKQIVTLVEEEGGQYKYGAQTIAAARLPLAGIARLLERAAVTRIEYRSTSMQLLEHEQDSIMLAHNRVAAVYEGLSPFVQPFRGQEVLLGVIDDGFEWKHPDFWMADSSTRILCLWDQNSLDARYTQQYYGYGAEWSKAAIDSYQCTHKALDHGSHVLGTAAGNAKATGKYRGIAPEADIALVAINEEGYFLSAFVDGVHYLLEKAQALGKPCIINSSVGSYISGHDGQDLYAQLVAELLEARPGQILVQAGGNARQSTFHLGVELQNDTAVTAFQYHQDLHKTHFTCYADTADWSGVEFFLELVEPQTGQTLAQTRRFKVGRDFSFNGGVAQHSERLFTDAQGHAVNLDIYIDQYESSYATMVEIASANALGYWQLHCSGTGKYDIWSDEEHTLSSNMITQNRPYYQAPDNQQTIVGFWTCAAPVVVVASYQNRQFIVNYTNDTVNVGTTGYPVGQISQFSSLGPTRTGLQKPDVTASGGQVMSAVSLSTLNRQRGLSFSHRLDKDGWHWLNRGTSMSAPMVAGAVGLYLECQPQATSQQVLAALHQYSRVDNDVWSQVAALPNAHWGYGKLDIEQLLTSCLVRGCTDSTAINYDSFATLPDSSACNYDIAITKIKKSTEWRCYPNPITQQGTITYDFNGANERRFVLCNALGQIVWAKALGRKQGYLNLAREQLPGGHYILYLETKNGRKTSAQQLFLSPNDP